jgi:uncharacterized membrane protein YidH (DUF202 family)
LLLIIAFPIGIVVTRLQLVLPLLIVCVLVTGHASWHRAEKAHQRLSRRVMVALVIGYLGLAALVFFTEFFVWAAFQRIQAGFA